MPNELELILTYIILKQAVQIRKHENIKDLSVEIPNLEPYIKKAIEELRDWHPIVMAEFRKIPNETK